MTDMEKYKKLLGGELTVHDVEVTDYDIAQMEDIVMYTIACKRTGDPGLVLWNSSTEIH